MGRIGRIGPISPMISVLEEKINAVKRLAVSTGQLKPLLVLHTRPIDLVVFQEPSHQRCGRPHLAEGFTLICLQRLSWPYVDYPAVPLARQQAHQRYVPPNPLVLGRKPRKSPAPTTDRDRPVSRRSKPSSRTAFIGEQPNPWELLNPQDAMSRHRTFSSIHAFAWRRLCLHPVVDFRFHPQRSRCALALRALGLGP